MDSGRKTSKFPYPAVGNMWLNWIIIEWKNVDHKKYINLNGIFNSAAHNWLFCPHPDSDFFVFLSISTCIFILTESKHYFWIHVCSWPLSCPSGQKCIKASNTVGQSALIVNVSFRVFWIWQLPAACFLLLAKSKWFLFWKNDFGEFSCPFY